MKLSSHLALVGSFFTTAHALGQSTWTMTNVPAAGIMDITFPITIVEADHFNGYYFAQQFNFVGLGNVGYTGIQPRLDDSDGQSVLHGVFSSFVPGSTSTDPNCHSGADGGSGVSCAVEWNGVYGRQYNFEVKNAGNTVWNGTAIDSVTGDRIHIGSYTLPDGSGGIKWSQYGFVEWYPWNTYKPPNHCTLLPYQKTIFGNPTTTNVGSVGTQNLEYESKAGDCVGQVAYHTEQVAGGAENDCGFKGQTGY